MVSSCEFVTFPLVSNFVVENSADPDEISSGSSLFAKITFWGFSFYKRVNKEAIKKRIRYFSELGSIMKETPSQISMKIEPGISHI